jgi:AGCS family alanine or glycine:cation symporter
MFEYEKIITSLDGYVWAFPLIALIFLSAAYFTVRLHFVQLRGLKHQFSLIFKKNDSKHGIKPMEAFFTIVAYRVGTANIAGVCVAILYGGPGAVVWMIICSLLDAAISYAECSLGQIFKIRQDGEYRGGSYYYLDRGLGLKKLGKLFAILTLICVPVLTVGPHANSIALAFKTSVGIPQWLTGTLVGALMLWTVFGGIKRIAKVATVIVPFMTGLYLLLTFAVIIMNIKDLPAMVVTMFSSAFAVHSVYGALLGKAIIWGVKRSVNSSGAGMGEAVPAAAAAEVAHPGESGLVNSLSVFIDVFVCFCTALIVLLSDCFNVLGPNGEYLHLGKGSQILAEQAVTKSAGIPWTQAAANTVVPNIGSLVIASCILFFAFTTVLNYYYQGETALAYLFNNSKEKTRKIAITVLRIVVPLTFLIFAIGTSTATFAVGSFGVGLMVWTNVIVLLIMSPTIIKIYRDYKSQRDSGIEEPVFNPEKLGIKNAEVWLDINRSKIAGTDSVK